MSPISLFNGKIKIGNGKIQIDFKKKHVIPPYLGRGIKKRLLVILFGLLAGAAVCLLCEFPHDDLWGLSYFSSETLGFWIFSSSLMALFADKRIRAWSNVFVYIFLMFIITGIYKIVRMFYYNNPDMGFTESADLKAMFSYLGENITEELIYSLIPAFICGFLGVVLWNARLSTRFGRVMIFMPPLFIAAEMVSLYREVFISHVKLSPAIMDTVCLIAYIIIFRKVMFPRAAAKAQAKKEAREKAAKNRRKK